MGKSHDTFRMLATPYTEARLKEMKQKQEPYPLDLPTLRNLPLLERARTLARIKADIPLLVKKRIPLAVTGATEHEIQALKYVLGYP